MDGEPKQSRQHGPQNEGSSSERTVAPPVGIGCFCNRQLELLPDATPGQEPARTGPGPGAVEPGPDRAQQFRFPRQRAGFVRTFLELDANDRPQQAQMPARHSVRIGDPITAEPLSKIPGLSDIKNRVTSVAHEIHAGALRQLAEKIDAQPLHQRLRIRKQ